MKHIVIDTNVVHLDHFLKGTNISVLCHTVNRLGHVIYIPQVVVDEMVKQYSEDVEELAKSYNNVLKTLPRIYGRKVNIAKIDKENFTKDYRQKLTERIKSLSVTILPYPKTRHDVIVAKELEQKKPFKDSMKGYRDALIWESVLELCTGVGGEEVVFVSANSKDFAKGDNILHPDLIEDCKKRGIEPKQTSLITKVSDFILNVIPTQLKDTTGIIDALNKNGAYGNINFTQELASSLTNDALSEMFVSDYFGERQAYCPGYYENPEISHADVPKYHFISVKELDENISLVTCEVAISIELDAYVFHGDLPLIDDDAMPFVVDYQWNEHYAYITDNVDVVLRMSIVIDKDFNEVQSIDRDVKHVKFETGYEFTD